MARRAQGIHAADLSDRDLERELKHLYETRAETFFGGSRSAFDTHTERMFELEGEYATRNPQDVAPKPARTRTGARARAGQPITGGASKREMRRTAGARRGTRAPATRTRGSRMDADQGRTSPTRARGGRAVTSTDRSGKRTEGRTTGRGRGVPGLPGSLGRRGGTPTRNASKRTGAANRRIGGRSTASAAARRGTGTGRRPKSGAQG